MTPVTPRPGPRRGGRREGPCPASAALGPGWALRGLPRPPGGEKQPGPQPVGPPRASQTFARRPSRCLRGERPARSPPAAAGPCPARAGPCPPGPPPRGGRRCGPAVGRLRPSSLPVEQALASSTASATSVAAMSPLPPGRPPPASRPAGRWGRCGFPPCPVLGYPLPAAQACYTWGRPSPCVRTVLPRRGPVLGLPWCSCSIAAGAGAARFPKAGGSALGVVRSWEGAFVPNSEPCTRTEARSCLGLLCTLGKKVRK